MQLLSRKSQNVNLSPSQVSSAEQNRILRKHRRKRAHKVYQPLLLAWPGTIVKWNWPFRNPYRWNAYHCATLNGVYTFDDFVTGDQRQFQPDGGSYYMYVVGVDAAGNEITGHSNVVRPDSVQANSLFTGMIGFWLLNEPAGLARVDSRNGRLFSEFDLDGGTPFVAQVPGNNGSAASFDTQRGCGLLCSGVYLTDLGIADSSYAFWFQYTTGAYENQTLLDVGGSVSISLNQATASISLNLTTSHESGNWTLTTDDVLAEGEWHHVVVTRAGSYVCIFYDGQARVDGLVNGDVIPAAGGSYFGQDDVVIGCGPWGYPLNGAIDDLGIWTRALTSAEVARLYNNGAGLGESWLFAP